MASNQEKKSKKTYTTPEIEIYGDLRAITKNVDNGHPHPDPPPHMLHDRT